MRRGEYTGSGVRMGLLASPPRPQMPPPLLHHQHPQHREQNRAHQMDSAGTSSHLNPARLSPPQLSDRQHRASCPDQHRHSQWHPWPREPQHSVHATLFHLRKTSPPPHRSLEPCTACRAVHCAYPPRSTPITTHSQTAGSSAPRATRRGWRTTIRKLASRPH